jgi:predicted nucleic acid-binding protein
LAISKRPERLVVDANPILAALLGGKARRIFFETSIREFAVPEATIREVRGYLPRLAVKLGGGRVALENAFELLPLTPYTGRTYGKSVAEAVDRIGRRDPKDVEVLALALHLGIPMWSNDRDVEDAGIHCITTARLLAMFF